MRVALAALLVALSGCLTSIANEHDYALYGAFTAEATQADYEEVGRLVKEHTGQELALMESFPPQFRVSGLESAECERLHDALKDKPYLGRLDACRSADAPEPVEGDTSA